VNFFGSIFAPRPKTDSKSGYFLWRTVPLLAFIFFIAFQVETDEDAASRQQTSFGLVTECRYYGKGGHYCDYTFPVGGEQYAGTSSANSNVQFGKTVVVYYDFQDPNRSALQDFSEKSRKDRNYLYLFLFLFAAFVAFILYSKTDYRRGSNQRGP
jgi:hypothetical protein